VNQEKGTTVILTTHDLGDIEELCKRVLIIDNGLLIYDGPLATIKERFGKFREITFETAADLDGMTLPDSTELLEKGERRLVLRFDRTKTSASRVAASVMSQIEVIDLSLKEPDLSLVVKQIYRGGLKEDGTNRIAEMLPGDLTNGEG
jgi:ABC-2 type transport system ATP-binding protein